MIHQARSRARVFCQHALAIAVGHFFGWRRHRQLKRFSYAEVEYGKASYNGSHKVPNAERSRPTNACVLGSPGNTKVAATTLLSLMAFTVVALALGKSVVAKPKPMSVTRPFCPFKRPQHPRMERMKSSAESCLDDKSDQNRFSERTESIAIHLRLWVSGQRWGMPDFNRAIISVLSSRRTPSYPRRRATIR